MLWDNIAEWAEGTWNNIVGIWNVVSGWFNENIIKPVGEFFTKLWNNICTLAEDTWTGITNIWKVVSDWFNDNIIRPVSGFFTTLWNNISKWAETSWKDITGVWNVVSGWFDNNIIKPVGKFFSGLWEDIKTVWKNAAGWFDTNVVQPIARTFKGLKTTMSGIWEGISGRLGVKSFGINIPTIPKLAAGTNYIPQDMLAYLHQGETVVPKKYNDEGSISSEAIAQAVYRAIIDAFRITQASSGQSGNDRDLVLKIDNTVLARMQLPAIIKEGQRQGLNLVVQGV